MWHGSSVETPDLSVVRAGAWQIRIQGPVKVTRPLSVVLSSIAIPEENLPALEVFISSSGRAHGMVDGTEAWTFTLPKRRWLSLLLGYAVGTAVSLLRELHFVHAGAVGVNGRGYVLVGPPGAGKTSMVGVLVRRGAAYLSDEVALLDPKTCTVHPFALPMAVKPWTARAIGPLPPAQLVESDADIQYLLPVRRAQGPVPLDSVVLLDPTQLAAEPAELSRAEMLLALSEQPSSFRYRERLEAAFSDFVRLLRSTRCLRVGSADPAKAASMLEQSL